MKSLNIKISKTTIIIFIILISALALRLYNINKYDLWFDEIGTDLFSAQNLREDSKAAGVPASSLMLKKMKNDPHSPLYYFLVYIYSSVFGDGKSLRILSMIFSMLSVLMLFKLTTLFYSQKVGIYAILIMTLSQFHIYYAQEARMYTAACFFSLLLTYIYIKALRTDKTFYWIAFPITGILSIYLSYFCGFLLAVFPTTLIIKRNRKYAVKLAISLLLIAIFLLFLKPLLLGQLSYVKKDFWTSKPYWHTLIYMLKFFNLGYSANNLQYKLGLFLFSALFAYGTYASYREDKKNTAILFSFFFLPTMIIFLFSKFVLPIFVIRHLIILCPFYYILIAKGIDGIKFRWLKLFICLCAIIPLMILSIFNYNIGFMSRHITDDVYSGGVVYPKKNYTKLFNFISNDYKDGDLIVAGDLQSYIITLSYIKKHRNDFSNAPLETFFRLFFHINYFTEYSRRFLQIQEPLNEVTYFMDEEVFDVATLPNGETDLKRIKVDDLKPKRIWLILSSWPLNGHAYINAIEVKYKLLRCYDIASEADNDGVFIILLEKKDTDK